MLFLSECELGLSHPHRVSNETLAIIQSGLELTLRPTRDLSSPTLHPASCETPRMDVQGWVAQGLGENRL